MYTLFMETLFPDECGHFQLNNGPCYKTKIVQEWFEEHANKFEVLTWPLNSPDINSFEHLRDVLDNEVHGGPHLTIYRT